MKQLIAIAFFALGSFAFSAGPNPIPNAQISGSSTVSGTLTNSGIITGGTINANALQLGGTDISSLFDSLGAAQAAQAYAIQRSNHTGTQPAGTITGLATVATSGSYGDLLGLPTIPTTLPATGGTANYASTSGSAAVSGSTLAIPAATQADVNTGTNTTTAVTPATLAPVLSKTLLSIYASTSTPRLFRYRSALSRALAGGTSARVLCVGDSITSGNGSNGTMQTNTRSTSWPSKTKDFFAACGIVANVQNECGTGLNPTWAQSLKDYDPLWIPGVTGWDDLHVVHPSWAVTLGGYALQLTGLNASPGSFNPIENYDTVDVYTIRYPTWGILDVTIAGTTTHINCAGSNGIIKTTINAPSGGSIGIVNSTPVTNSDLGILAVVPYKKLGGVTVINAGRSGIIASDVASSAALFGPPTAMITELSPDLTIIGLVANDAQIATDLTAYKSSLATIGNAAAASGDVVFMICPPANDAPRATNIPIYAEAVQEVADANGWGVINLYERWGKNYSRMAALGFYFDAVHPDGAGYTDIAEAVISCLINP